MSELIVRAVEAELTFFSITDHDTVRAYGEIPEAACGLHLIPGIELSTCWHGTDIHVIGLNIAPQSAAMAEAERFQQNQRAQRAQRISAALQRAGAPDLLAEACSLAGANAPGRPHFAKCLVNAGVVKDEKQAFKRFLGRSKYGDVPNSWADMATVIRWIEDAGGIAVLAHPARYRLSKRRLLALLESFKNAGGRAMEVVSGRQDPATTGQLADLSLHFALLASGGSDFHAPSQTWLQLGLSEPLPKRCTPVWTAF
ncbi:MAG: phosphatase [Gammaproteobacteria bacterium]|nr:phosphatase [Gammaproteobacteria bacterium]